MYSAKLQGVQKFSYFIYQQWRIWKGNKEIKKTFIYYSFQKDKAHRNKFTQVGERLVHRKLMKHVEGNERGLN